VRYSNQPYLGDRLQKILQYYKIDEVVDVGANMGQFYSSIRDIGYKKVIYSFEPLLPAYTNLLELARKDKLLKTFNFALGGEDGEGIINISSASVFSSLLNISDYGKNIYPQMESKTSQKIKIRTINSCLKEGLIHSGNSILLKMDTQGYDIEVLKGADNILSRVSCVISEMSVIPIYQNMPHYLDALRVFEEKGFFLSGVFPVNYDKDMSIIEFDALLIKKY